MDGQELWEIIEGLQANDLLQYTHLLTGYIASVSFLETVAKIVKALRQKNPDLVYSKALASSSMHMFPLQSCNEQHVDTDEALQSSRSLRSCHGG